MAEFLNTSKAYAEIEDIINKTRSKVVLISPYIKIPELLFDRLKYIDGKRIRIVVVCREGDLKADVRSDLKQLKNLELRFDENLHAKCFYNEESMVISSLNLYDYSQQNNREMGILLRLKDDHNVFNEARIEAEYIVDRATLDSQITGVSKIKETKPRIYSTPRDEPKAAGVTRTTRRTSKPGFCIRCGTKIPYELDAPYCRDCYRVWAEWENPEYEESYCHTCGKPVPATILKPQCYSCYNNY